MQASLSSTKPTRLYGLILTFALATAAAFLGNWFPVIGGPVFGILLGMLVKSSGKVSPTFKPGIAFSSKQLLQTSIVLLGFTLSLRQIWSTGTSSLTVMLTTLAAALIGAWLLGRALGVSGDLTAMIGCGTGICGGSAIAAVSSVLGAEEQEVAYSISTIFAFNVVAVLLFPILGHLFGMSQHAFGLWAGTAVNDTSSVVAAAVSYGKEAGDYATVVKLTRTTMIIPITFAIAAWRTVKAQRSGSGATKVNLRKIIPWFVLWFLVASLINTAGFVPGIFKLAAGTTAKFLIVVALTAVGLSADFKQMAKTGLKPMLLGFLLWMIVAGTSLIMQHATGQF
ncbi:MAG: YeiH family protein [Mycobacterium leprae]